MQERCWTNPKTLLMLHKWGLHIPDAAEKASMQMYSPLSSALLWKVLLQVQSCISDFLRWKFPAYLKEMSFLCWALSPRIIQFDKFLTLLLSVDCNGSYFWGDGMEGSWHLVTLSNTLLPCTLWRHYVSRSRVLSVHLAVLCVPALRAQQWPLQPRLFLLLSFSACAINFSLSISFDGLDLETAVAVSTDRFRQKLSIFPIKMSCLQKAFYNKSFTNAFWWSRRKDWCLSSAKP